MSQNVLRENERLRLLVEELKRENQGLQSSVSESMVQAQQFMEMHQQQVQQLTHLVHCASCRAEAGISDPAMELPDVALEGAWGAN